MPLSLPDYQTVVQRTRTAVASQLALMWGALPDYRDASIDRFIRIAVPKVHAGQIATARATAAYLGGAVLPRETITTVRQVDPVVEYRRPAVSLYTALTQGLSLADAITAGGNRLDDLVTTDLQLAKTVQADASMQATGFRYYRRVLSGSESCGICVIASTQRYRVGNLLPIHPGCDCGVEPVDAGFDPGQVLDSELLESTHAAVLDTTGFYDRAARDLGISKTDAQGRPVSDFTELIVTHQHGEYGPTLAWRSDRFTGPADI